MRALVLGALAACSPHIASGAYLCGPEQSCPEGQLCNGPDNVCVGESVAQVFDCTEDFPDPFNDDTPATGTTFNGLQCVSGVTQAFGCLTIDDNGDWYQFDTPAGCTTVGVDVIVTFPIAFEPIALQLSTDGGPPEVADTACRNPPNEELGDDARCFATALAPGHHYAIGVVHSGSADCSHRCANNRYTLKLQLVTP